MTPAHLIRERLSARTIQRFADKVGLVYFGYVDQRDDDHRLVRGHTVSLTHIDNHYSIGSWKGYDVGLVARNDVVKLGAKSNQRCHWLIVTIDLHTTYELPHIYIGHNSVRRTFEASGSKLSVLQTGTFGVYPAEFANGYSLYGQPSHSIEIEQIITPQIAGVIAAEFHGSSIEIEDNSIYLYIETQRPTEALLEKLLTRGIWLAETLDATLKN